MNKKLFGIKLSIFISLFVCFIIAFFVWFIAKYIELSELEEAALMFGRKYL